ncbi:hypothetical protein AcV5_009395 [Taiwanofungus camphoratus]|nr:hypothetical protein AcV5_009395 [Antrodia cinnamomea]
MTSQTRQGPPPLLRDIYVLAWWEDKGPVIVTLSRTALTPILQRRLPEPTCLLSAVGVARMVPLTSPARERCAVCECEAKSRIPHGSIFTRAKFTFHQSVFAPNSNSSKKKIGK